MKETSKFILIVIMLILGGVLSYLYLFQGNLMKEVTPLVLFVVFVILFGIWLNRNHKEGIEK
jgi:CHASE2 domain-containing sensor protein